jgi:UDP-hydrolysing UDP-N-acetyl-D-glucosamine 2-epimerase
MHKKLMVAVTNRSSYNKVKTIVGNLYNNVDPVFLLGGGVNIYRFAGISHLIERDFPNAEIRHVHMAVDGDDLTKMSKTVGLGLIEIATLIDNLKVDAVLTVADRFETLATAIASSYTNIPLIHLQGGEITGTIDNKVRNAISQLADIHFPATQESAYRLERYIGGMKGKHIYPYGCPSMDLLVSREDNAKIRHARKVDDVLPVESVSAAIVHAASAINSKGGGAYINTEKPFIVVLFHSDTTDDAFLRGIHQLPSALDKMDVQKVVFWNNIDPKGEHIAKMWREHQQQKRDDTRYIRHIEPEDFGSILAVCGCVVGNSSTGIRESSFVGTPSVNIGFRQNSRECADNCITIPMKERAIIESVESQIEHGHYKPSDLYGNGKAGQQIAWRISNVLWQQ